MANRPGSLWVAILLFTTACGGLMVALLLAFGQTPTLFHAAELAYFAGVTGVLHRWQESGLAIDPQGMVRRFMTGLVIKMLVSLLVLVVLVLIAPKHLAMQLGVGFGALYLAFLAFSTVRLSALLRRTKSP